MENKKKIIVLCSLLVAFILIGVGTLAYFRRNVNGEITADIGYLNLVVNEADSAKEETFEIVLKRSEEEAFILPDDKGYFDLVIDSSGSGSDVKIVIELLKVNLPEHLRFYMDENYEIPASTIYEFFEYGSEMEKTVRIYWYWDGNCDDVNDSQYINTTISATINVSATAIDTTYLYDTLAEMSVMDNVSSDFVGSSTGIDFSLGSSDTNGKGLYTFSSTADDKYPVMYYRGNVINNNVVFGNMCWLIVRTTETGGIKIIYNGTVNVDGSCTNYSLVGGNTTTNYQKLIINGSYPYNDFLPVGNADYTAPSVTTAFYMLDKSKVFFRVLDPSVSTTDAATDFVKFKQYLNDFTLDSETGRHVQNKDDSKVKEIFDGWYVANIHGKDFESLLEDTVWCSDRSVTSSTYTIDNFDENGGKFNYSAYTRLIETSSVNPSVKCNRYIDSFTVSRLNGNGDLTYPIGTLTADEDIMAGNGIYYDSNREMYLYNGGNPSWTLTPAYQYSNNNANVFYFSTQSLNSTGSPAPFGLRPMVSLRRDVRLISGDGSFATPYVVK